MTNIIDYIQWRGDLSFEMDRLNAVDNLILARLSYINFDDLGPRGETLYSIAQRYADSEEKMNPGLMLKEGTKPLIEAAGKSHRFGALTVKSFVSKIDMAIQLQFSAVTFELDKKSAYVAFRGTDDTLVGWKEDFNMSFMDKVPAQIEAVNYLHNIIEREGYKNVYVGGHSKGGNLAVFSSINLKRKLKSHLIAVYNNDGPGFKPNVINSSDYRDISDRIVTLVPQSSVVGLLLEHEENHRIIESNQKGIMQHDCLSWNVKGKDFIYLPELTGKARMLDQTTKSLLEKMSLEQRESFVSILFDLLSVNESKTLTDLKKGGISNLIKLSGNFNKMDRETKRIILEPLSLFFGESFRNFLAMTELDQVKCKLKNWQNETKREIEAFIRKLS
jgi:hypothetical protein